VTVDLRHLWQVMQRYSGVDSSDEHGSGLDQDWSQFWPDQDWIGLQFFPKLADQDWIGLGIFFCFYVIILKISKILVVIRLHRFAKWSCIFCHHMQIPCWDYFAIRTLYSLCLFSLMRQKRCWEHFAFNQSYIFMLADQDWIGRMIFNNFADQDWIQFHRIRTGLGLKNFTVRSSLVDSPKIFGGPKDLAVQNIWC